LAVGYWLGETVRIFIAALVGGLIVGGIGFAAGFFGPMILDPTSGNGPLLGIFITGPLGFVVGCVGGAIAGFVRSKRKPPPP
jgi:hypothetical protein